MSDLIELLKKKSFDFDFFQVVTLLEEYYGSSGKDRDPLATGRIKFSANPEISFPSCDIPSVKAHGDWGIELYLSFMGLLGISSPLPHYFTEYGARKNRESCALTDFLNVFDHRLYTFFYRAWKKYRPVPTWSQNDQFDIYKRVASLAGLLGNDDASSRDSALMAYAGLFAGVSHNAAGLAEILTDCFSGVMVTVEQWSPRWAKVSNLQKLGIDFGLGNEAMLGERIFDRSGKILVVLKLTDKNVFEKYLPGSENISRIKEIVKLFSSQPLAFDIEVRFTPADLIQVVLGKDTAPLGISSSCGNAADQAEGYFITIPGRE